MDALRTILLLAAGVAALAPRTATASCAGPPECCPSEVVSELPSQVTVDLGLVLLGVSNITEAAGTWVADYYLFEWWPAQPGFTPQTEVSNEVVRTSVQFDRTELDEGGCHRWRRIQSVVHSDFELRAFPFDEQALYLDVSDALYPADSLVYADEPLSLAIDPEARSHLKSWHISRDLQFGHELESFSAEGEDAAYDNATFELRVRRETAFHITRFFLPLFVILVIAFSVFWMNPQDLGSQTTVGVTCLLAAIAFQLTQVSSLPQIGYLTFADVVYTISYVLIALALAESVYTNRLSLSEKTAQAAKVDRWAQIAFPLATVVGVVLAAVLKL